MPVLLPQVTMQLFGVSRFKVYVAKVHASTDGAARRTPPSLSSFRIKPEVAAKLNAFANDPSNVQLLADNKGASHVSVALKQVPEKLYKKYEAEVPKEEQVSRSTFLEWFNQPVFCLMRGKSCLCGPCTEHGTQAFEDVKALLAALVVAGLDKKVAASLQARIDALHDHLAHHYRGACSLSDTCASRCIPFALSGAGAFGCSCDHEHVMSNEKDNERFYLVDDLRGVLRALRKKLPAGVEREDFDAQLDEREEELAAFERHLALYQARARCICYVVLLGRAATRCCGSPIRGALCRSASVIWYTQQRSV